MRVKYMPSQVVFSVELIAWDYIIEKKTEPAKFWIDVGSEPPTCQYSIIISKAEKIAFPNLALNAWGSRLIIALFLIESCFIYTFKGAIFPMFPSLDMSSSGI
jgi:hypothetical protein